MREMSANKIVFLPDNIMRTPIHVYGMDSLDDAREYFLSLNQRERREAWYTISKVIDERTRSYHDDVIKEKGFKVSGIIQCLYEGNTKHYPSRNDKEHVQFAMKVGDLRPDYFNNFLEKFSSFNCELGSEYDIVLSELRTAVRKLWWEVEKGANKKLEFAKKRMEKMKCNRDIQLFVENLSKSIKRGMVDYDAYHGQLVKMLEKRIHRFEKLHGSTTADEIDWLRKNIKDGHSIGIHSIRRFQDLAWLMVEMKTDGSVVLRNIKKHYIFSLESFKKNINDHYYNTGKFFHVGDLFIDIAKPFQEIINRLHELSDTVLDFREYLENSEYTQSMEQAYKDGWILENEHGDKKWYVDFFKEENKVHQSDYFGKNIYDELR
jgi:hypothetical protein